MVEFKKGEQVEFFLINGDKITVTLIDKNEKGFLAVQGEFDFFIPFTSVLYIRKYNPKIEKI